MKGVVDSRKSLTVLQQEWLGCTDCTLGELRNLRNENQVFGAGTGKGGILFVGSEPDRDAEREYRPIGGKAELFLAKLLQSLRIRKFHITNLVACRACAPVLDEAGNPILTRGYGGRLPEPRYKDQRALRPQLEACSARVYEEIYIVDPLVIVAFGQPAAATLYGNSINITRDRGEPKTISIPGAGQVATLSPKKREWFRKVHGKLVSPVERSKVDYLMIPTLHPIEVREAIHNKQKNNPFSLFAADLVKAKRLYDLYNEELYGHVPDDMVGIEETLYDIADEFRQDDEEARNGNE